MHFTNHSLAIALFHDVAMQDALISALRCKLDERYCVIFIDVFVVVVVLHFRDYPSWRHWKLILK
jgi:hypothetical protein